MVIKIVFSKKVPITKKDEIAAEADTKEVESNEKDGSKAEKVGGHFLNIRN